MENKNRPLIFVSNDDGYYAKGLAVLIDIVSKYGDVIAVTTESARSGMSHAITIKDPLRLKKIKDEPGVEIYKCNGTPVDCVKLGLNQVVPRRPDIMVSGINHGSNASISVIYSGTMGAAIEACLNGITSIGFSLLDHDANADFSVAKKYVENIFKFVLENGLPDYTTLNVNVPKLPESEIKGVRVCRQTHGTWKEKFEKRTDPHNHDYYWLTGSFNNFEPEAKDTDEWALMNNYVAVVPIKADFTAYHALEHITKLNHDNDA
ncbi:MAG: 5'/3'-nucleotidase SurE [Salinivirgaceae bacterium]